MRPERLVDPPAPSEGRAAVAGQLTRTPPPPILVVRLPGETHQRRGIGTELVRRAIELAAEAGGDWLHVDSDEVLMRDFYGPCGFVPTPAGLVNLHAARGGMAPGEERLGGGARWPISREGEVVYKAAGPWTPTVHALLRHLEAAGFAGAPRLVGPGIAPDGREMLSFIEGATMHPRAWTDEGVAAAGRLLRRLHDATASFEPPPDAVWQHWGAIVRPGPDDPDRIIGHCDTGPWNLIARDGLPVAWVDREFAGPVNRMDEVAATAFLSCQLHDDDVAERNGLPHLEDRARQLAIFCDAYGLEDRFREGLVERMVVVAVRGSARDAEEARISPETTGPIPLVWGVAWQVRSAAWMVRHRRLLEGAVRRPTSRAATATGGRLRSTPGSGRAPCCSASTGWENWGWLESRSEDRDLAAADGRPPRRFCRVPGVRQRRRPRWWRSGSRGSCGGVRETGTPAS